MQKSRFSHDVAKMSLIQGFISTFWVKSKFCVNQYWNFAQEENISNTSFLIFYLEQKKADIFVPQEMNKLLVKRKSNKPRVYSLL